MTVEPPPKETQYYIELTVPPAYQHRWLHFAQVVASMYLGSSEAAIQRRVQYLVEKLRDPELRLTACYGLEALGQPAVEPVAALLSDADRAVAVTAATVLIALGDTQGTPVLIEAARDPNCPERPAAIGALSRSDDPAALRVLQDLAGSSNIQIRLTAYESLRQMRDQAVVEHVDKIALRGQQYEIHRFGVDLVHTEGPSLIVASAVNDPRLIFFGDEIQFKPPFFFDEGRYWAIAEEKATAITVRPPEPPPRRPLLRSTIEIPFNVLYYVVLMDQLGATYPEVLNRLREADGLGRMTAPFAIREAPAAPPPERPWD